VIKSKATLIEKLSDLIAERKENIFLRISMDFILILKFRSHSACISVKENFELNFPLNLQIFETYVYENSNKENILKR
jgi:hypothetical protein